MSSACLACNIEPSITSPSFAVPQAHCSLNHLIVLTPSRPAKTSPSQCGVPRALSRLRQCVICRSVDLDAPSTHPPPVRYMAVCVSSQPSSNHEVFVPQLDYSPVGARRSVTIDMRLRSAWSPAHFSCQTKATEASASRVPAPFFCATAVRPSPGRSHAVFSLVQ